jgi:quinol monooxygenase YgiN
MSQLLIVEFFVKDQASATTIWDILGGRQRAMKEAGCHKFERYVDQDDPNHLVYTASWASRGHAEEYLKWARAQPQDFQACYASPPRSTWLDEIEA